ncbi:MAG: hypothetical protein KDA97_04740 [Acidimicrobiales bacterium]|nr:hypothetical protein [Acidimicrobiales bacterium]
MASIAPTTASAVLVSFVFEILFEILFEIVFEVVGELVVQVLGDAVFRPLWRRFGSEARKRFLIGLLAAITAFVAGVGWGVYRGVDGATTLPASIWSTVVLAIGFLALSRLKDADGGPVEGRPRQPHEVWSDGASAYLPWLWDRRRLENFAGVNAVVAAGILTGYLAWV